MLARRGAALLAAALSVLLAGAGHAWGAAGTSPPAGPPPGLSLVPPGQHGYAEVDLGPGGTATFHFQVANHGTAPVAYDLATVGASTAETTGVNYGQPGAAPAGSHDLVRWLSLSRRHVVVPPGRAALVDATVRVPAGIGPGDYVGGVAGALPPQEQSAANGAVALKTTTRTVIAVVVHVPGALARGFSLARPTLLTSRSGRQYLSVPMTSAGDALVKPDAAVTLRACDGGPPVFQASRHLDTFVPRTAIRYPWLMTTPITADCLDGVVTLGGPGGPVARWSGRVPVQKAELPVSGSGSVGAAQAPGRSEGAPQGRLPWAVPLAGSLVLLLLVLIVVLAVREYLRRRRRAAAVPWPAAPPATPVPPAPAPPAPVPSPRPSDALDRLRTGSRQ